MMGSFAERLANGGRPRWIERTEYCGRLLAGGEIPWLDVGAFISWQRQAEGLVKSDVTVFPATALCAAWLDAHPDLRQAMGQKSRPLSPLKTLLADEALRRHAGDCLSALSESKGARSLVFAVPSPRRWIDLAWDAAPAGAEAPESGSDETETAAMYVADFLRAFAAVPLDALVLEESGNMAVDAANYQPVFNLAGHYHWDVGLLLPGGTQGGVLAGAAFAISPENVEGVPTGLMQGDDVWQGAAFVPCAETGFTYVHVPADCSPEIVLERLAAL